MPPGRGRDCKDAPGGLHDPGRVCFEAAALVIDLTESVRETLT